MVSVSSVPVNTVPVANAGHDQSVFVGANAALDGSGTNDADGDGLSYSWSFVMKPFDSGAVLFNDTAVNPGFVADVSGSYVVQLIVNDAVSDSLPDTVSITASNGSVNLPPVANAGQDQVVVKGDLVKLRGAASSDPNGDILTYRWSFSSRPTRSLETLTGHTSDSPCFTADAVGLYLLQLMVNDGQYDSVPDTVTIRVDDFVTVSEG